MFHGIKCTEILKTTTAIDQESLNPTYKSAMLTTVNCVPSRICAKSDNDSHNQMKTGK